MYDDVFAGSVESADFVSEGKQRDSMVGNAMVRPSHELKLGHLTALPILHNNRRMNTNWGTSRLSPSYATTLG